VGSLDPRLDRPRFDETRIDEVVERPVHERPADRPDAAELGLGRELTGDGEAVTRLLAEDGQHDPVRE
jgi:hypothetical protein